MVEPSLGFAGSAPDLKVEVLHPVAVKLSLGSLWGFQKGRVFLSVSMVSYFFFRETVGFGLFFSEMPA